MGGYFYFIKWKNGLLVADRAIQSSISAQSLNKAGYYEGSKYRVLTEAEFNDVIVDDFGGQFKFSNNPQTTFTVANNINRSNYNDSFTNIALLFQALFTQRYFGVIWTTESGTYDRNKCSFASPSEVVIVNIKSVTHIYTFLPCMEYVDNSKSTNIFY